MTATMNQAAYPSRPPLRRSRNHKLVGGVIGGLAEFTGLDPSLARVLYVLLSIFSSAFPGVLVYIVCWILIPLEDDDLHV
jgi:phage shock protein C